MTLKLAMISTIAVLCMATPATAQWLKTEPAPQTDIYAETDTDRALGAEDAPVTIIIYASYTCPHCAAWFEQIWPTLKTDYIETGKARAVFRDYPVPERGLATYIAVIGRCVPEDRFYDYVETRMAGQDEMYVKHRGEAPWTARNDIIADSGLSPEEVLACETHPEREAGTDTNIRRFQATIFDGIPALAIDGTPYEGNDFDWNAIKQTIETRLAHDKS